MKKNLVSILVIVLCLVSCQTSPKDKDEKNITAIGVVEDARPQQQVRALFIYNQGDWKVLPNQLKEMQWAIFYSGNEIGMLKTEALTPKFSNDQGKLLVKGDIGNALMISNGSENYENWEGIPKYRPLIAVSGIKSEQISLTQRRMSSDEFEKVFKEFRKLVVSVTNCKNSKKLFNYKAKDLKNLSAIQIEEGKVLLGIQLNNDLNKCDGPRTSVWSQHWFILKNNKIKFLGNNIYPVDGLKNDIYMSPWLFSKAQYNEDGYVLFYDNFEKSISTSWKYH